MEIKTLGEIFELQRGYDLTHSQMNDGTVPVAGSNGVIGYHNAAKLTPPCITIGRSGSVGKLHRYNEPIWPHNTTLYVSDFKGNDADYLYYLLKTIDFEKVCDSSVIPSLNRNFVYPMKVCFEVDSKKQQKIASVLSALDSKIALNKRMNQKLESMAKRLYDYWFVQYDFPDENGRPYKTSGGPMTHNPTLNRQIPQGWEVKKLSDIANITMGQSPEGSSYNENGEGEIFYQGCTDFGTMFPTPRQYTTAPTRFAKANDILMSVRAPVGTLNIANTDCCIGRGLAALNSKKGSNVFLYYVMKNFESHFANAYSMGTTFGSITKIELFDLPVLHPTPKTLQAFNAQVTPLFQQQLVNARQIETLTRQRDTLLPLLMTGQVTV